MNYKTVADTTQAVIEIQHHALENIAEWGLQDLKTLIVVATEELGETAKEVLNHEQNIGKNSEDVLLYRIRDEAKDFAAVGLQIMALVEKLKRRGNND